LIKLLADENIPKKTVEALKQREIDIARARPKNPNRE
jgi:hypothetical protein